MVFASGRYTEVHSNSIQESGQLNADSFWIHTFLVNIIVWVQIKGPPEIRLMYVCCDFFQHLLASFLCFCFIFFLQSILLNCMNKIVGLFLGYTILLLLQKLLMVMKGNKIPSFISLRNSWTLLISTHSSGLQLCIKTVLFGHLVDKILGHILSKCASLKCKLLVLRFLALKETLEGDNQAWVYGLAKWDTTTITSFSFEEPNWYSWLY